MGEPTVTADPDATNVREASVPPPAAAPAEPAPMSAPRYPFSVLRVLRTAMRVTKQNLVAFFLIACVLELPLVLLQFTAERGNLVIILLVQQITDALTISVVAYGVVMELHGTRSSTRNCITTGFAQLGRVLGVTLISTLAIGAATLLLVVPGIIVALRFYVVVPVTLFEGVGIAAAMKRSRELTNGRKGDLFLISLLAYASGTAIVLVEQYQFGGGAAVVFRALGSAFTSMFFAVTVGVVYVELRKLRDGVQIPEIATAFARIRK